MVLSFYSALVRLHLECCTHLWGSQDKRNMDLLEKIQNRTTKKDDQRLELRELALFILETAKLLEDLIAAFQQPFSSLSALKGGL